MSLLSPRALVPPHAIPPLTPRLLLGIAGAVLAGLMSLLNARLTAFGLADMNGAFGYGVVEGEWIDAAFSTGQIAIVPLTPWLAGIVSLRRLLAGSLVLLVVAALAAAGAESYTALLVARFGQGLGAGALLPLLLMTVLRFLPLHQRVWGIAAYGCLTTLTPTLCETLAGIFTEYLTWKAIFWQNLLLAPVALALVLVGLPLEPLRPEGFRRADYFGLLTSVVGLSALTLALSQGQNLDWFDSGVVCGLFAMAAIMLGAFVLHELAVPRPLIDLRLLGRRNFSIGLMVIVAFSFTQLGSNYLLPQYATQVHSFRELEIGEILIWLAVPQLVLSPLAAVALRLLDTRLVLAAGLTVFAVGAWMSAFITADWMRDDLLPGLLVQSCGFPFIVVPLIFMSTSTLGPADAASGGALFNILRTVAATTGGAVVGAILTVRERVHSALILQNVQVGEVPDAAASAIAARAHAQAFVMASADAYGALALIALGCLVLLLPAGETRVAYPPARGT